MQTSQISKNSPTELTCKRCATPIQSRSMFGVIEARYKKNADNQAIVPCMYEPMALVNVALCDNCIRKAKRKAVFKALAWIVGGLLLMGVAIEAIRELYGSGRGQQTILFALIMIGTGFLVAISAIIQLVKALYHKEPQNPTESTGLPGEFYTASKQVDTNDIVYSPYSELQYYPALTICSDELFHVSFTVTVEQINKASAQSASQHSRNAALATLRQWMNGLENNRI